MGSIILNVKVIEAWKGQCSRGQAFSSEKEEK